MEDDEARYLIDQYNKYVSWAERLHETTATFVILTVAVTSLFLSVVSYFSRGGTNQDPTSNLFVFVFAWGMAGFAASVFLWFSVSLRSRYLDHWRRLSILEDYRSRFKSLPDCITFRKVVESKPSELEKLLKDAENRCARQSLPKMQKG